MKRTRVLLVAGVLLLAAAAGGVPDVGTGADESKSAAAQPSDLYVFRWLELSTGPDGIDLRAGHFGEGVRGLLAETGARDRLGTLELADPETAIAQLRKLGDLKVLERARIVVSRDGAGQYVSGTKLPITVAESRGDATYVKTVFEEVGANVALQRLTRDEVRYEVKLAAATGRGAWAKVPLISNRAWEASTALPAGHTLVLATQVRQDPWIGTPYDAKSDDAAKARKTDTRIWIVLITRTALR